MIEDVDIVGIFAPAIVLLMLIAWMLNLAVKRVLEQVGFYRLVWHRHLFDLSMYVVILGILVLFTVPRK
ncbi:DUF1656 domain-containing protein [Paraburkholderia phytofirmans]|uniref:DUF1656 domain-containing protein n=1 Tax=Paraburkholderia phytofirmans OLGA172 TaxID=1417228 RepID=A0A161I2R7_9BURK|nr:DUF1656 domain-containing protein [Paraburkholderia phytofirmans]ANB75283.1 hypothetical protein AYM40_23095 [Paraburkholderia phytofirmans OLGA172]